MRIEILAVLIQEGGKLCSEWLRIRSHSPKQVKDSEPLPSTSAEPQAVEIEQGVNESKATSIKVGCIPCAIGHFGTCSGLLNESMRFARSDGLQSNEVIDRISHCLQELNTMEREDLTSEKIVNLPPWEKELALEALEASRATRHLLEGINKIDDLENATADTQTASTQISRRWFKHRLANMSESEKKKLAEKAIDKLED